MPHPSSIQLGDTGKSSKSPMSNTIDALPPDYDSTEMEDGEKCPVPLKRALPLQTSVHLTKAVTLETPVDQVTYHGLDVDNLLALSRSKTEEAMRSISSSRSSLSIIGGVSGEFSNPESEGGEEEEDGNGQEKGKRVKRRKLKNGIKDEMEDAINTNVIGTVEGNLDGLSDVPSSVSYMDTPHPSFAGPVHSISFSVPDPESPRQDLSPA